MEKFTGNEQEEDALFFFKLSGTVRRRMRYTPDWLKGMLNCIEIVSYHDRDERNDEKGRRKSKRNGNSYVGMILQRNCTTVHAPRIPFKYKIKFNRML